MLTLYEALIFNRCFKLPCAVETGDAITVSTADIPAWYCVVAHNSRACASSSAISDFTRSKRPSLMFVDCVIAVDTLLRNGCNICLDVSVAFAILPHALLKSFPAILFA